MIEVIRKYPIPSLLLMIAVIAIGGYSIYRVVLWKRDLNIRTKLMTGCYSDQLCEIAGAYKEAVAEKKSSWPTKAEVIEKIKPEARNQMLNCTVAHQPFVWNESIVNLTLKCPYPVPLVWCPPGSHGQYVGVVLLRDGEIRYEMMTESDRQHLIPPER